MGIPWTKEELMKANLKLMNENKDLKDHRENLNSIIFDLEKENKHLKEKIWVLENCETE